MDLGDLFSGVADVAAGSMTSSAAKGDNDGCAVVGIFVLVAALIGGAIMGISKMVSKPEEPVKPPAVKVEEKPKETFSHFLGRKTKDSVIEFGKGVIGK